MKFFFKMTLIWIFILFITLLLFIDTTFNTHHDYSLNNILNIVSMATTLSGVIYALLYLIFSFKHLFEFYKQTQIESLELEKEMRNLEFRKMREMQEDYGD